MMYGMGWPGAFGAGKVRNLGSNFVRDSKRSLIVVSTFLKDRKLGSFFLSDSKRSLIVVSHFPRYKYVGLRSLDARIVKFQNE